jgi:hypothetical protein
MEIKNPLIAMKIPSIFKVQSWKLDVLLLCFCIAFAGGLQAAGPTPLKDAVFSGNATMSANSTLNLTGGNVTYSADVTRLGSVIDLGTADVSGNLSWSALSKNGSSILHLADMPASFSGAGGKALKVNSGATAIEFVATGSGISWSSAPDTETANGTAGDVAYDSGHFYVCIASNSWLRTALTTWSVTPESLASLAGWWKASDFDATADTTEITTWSDSSGASLTASSLGGNGTYPTVARNALNTSMTAVTVTSDRGLQVTWAPASTGNWTVMAVINFTANGTTENDFFAYGDGVSNGMRLGRKTSGGVGTLVYPNVGAYDTTGTLSTGAWHTIIVTCDSGTETWYLDGAALTWGSTPGAQSGTTTTIKLLEGNNNANYLGILQCAEIAVFDDGIDSTTATNLTEYATTRYGL